MRALEKDRERRYQQMSDLERDLERLLSGDHNVGLPAQVEPPVAPLPRARVGQRWHLGVFGVLAIGVGIAVALVRTDEGAPPAPPPPAARAPALNPAPPPPVPPPAPLHVAPPVTPEPPPPAAVPAAAEARPPGAKRRSRGSDRASPKGGQGQMLRTGGDLILPSRPIGRAPK
jgi:hypothetical protein